MQKTLLINLTAIFMLIIAFVFTVGPARAANRDDMQQKMQAYTYQVRPQPESNNFESWQLATAFIALSVIGGQFYWSKNHRLGIN